MWEQQDIQVAVKSNPPNGGNQCHLPFPGPASNTLIHKRIQKFRLRRDIPATAHRQQRWKFAADSRSALQSRLNKRYCELFGLTD
jgi:hypothetical protein